MSSKPFSFSVASEKEKKRRKKTYQASCKIPYSPHHLANGPSFTFVMFLFCFCFMLGKKRVLKGWGVRRIPIPFPSPYFFQIPLPSAQIPFCLRLKGLKNIYPIPILTFFPFPLPKSQSQCPKSHFP